MKTRAFILSIVVSGSILVLPGIAVGKTAGCPCSPCKCSPCSCGGGKGGKHHHDHGNVGVGMNVDLGGVGQRKAEADPFAVGGGSTTPHTQEKHKSKTKENEVTTTGSFSNVELTGEKAKDEGNRPGPINISDDNENPPQLPKAETFTPPTMDDLKKARDDYHTAEGKFKDGDPDYQAALKQFNANVGIARRGSKEEEKVHDAIRKMRQRIGHFAQSDGKTLFDDWMKAYQSLNKPGADIADDMVPPDALERAKHDLAKAQNAVKTARDSYEDWKNYVVNNRDTVKNMQAAIDELKKKPHFSEKDAQADRDKVKQLQADLDNAKKQIAKEWASTDGAKEQMKNVQKAEQDLDKAKDAFKPFEGLEKNPLKSATNP